MNKNGAKCAKNVPSVPKVCQKCAKKCAKCAKTVPEVCQKWCRVAKNCAKCASGVLKVCAIKVNFAEIKCYQSIN